MIEEAPHLAASRLQNIPILRVMARRRIRFNQLARPVRILALIGLAQIGVAILLNVVYQLPQASIVVGEQANQTVVMPIAVFSFAIISLIIAWSFILTGALRTHWLMRFTVILGMTAILSSVPLAYPGLWASPLHNPSDVPATINWFMAWLQLIALASFWLRGILITVEEVRLRRANTPQSWEVFRLWDFWLSLVAFLFFFGADIVEAIAYSNVTTELTGIKFSLEFTIILGLLPLVLFWSSSDFAEWGQTVGEELLTSTRKYLWTTPTLVILAAVGAVGYIAWTIHWHFLVLIPSIIVAVLFWGLLGLVTAGAKLGRSWPASVTPQTLVVGALTLFAYTQLRASVATPLFVHTFLPWLPSYSEAQGALYAQIVGVVFALATLTVAITFVARGSTKSNGALAGMGLFLLFEGLILLLFSGQDALDLIHLPQVILPALALQYGLLFVMALVGLGVALWLLIRRHIAQGYEVMKALLAGIGGLLLLVLIARFYTINVSNNLLQGLLLLGAIGWDVFTSGESLTNAQSPQFPRYARVLLYFGYTLLATVTVLTISSQVLQGTQTPAYSYQDTNDVLIGLYTIGITFVFCTVVQQWARNVGAEAVIETNGTTGMGGGRVFHAHGLWGGAVALGLLLVAALVVSGLQIAAGPAAAGSVNLTTPTPLPSSGYQAAVPGPNCANDGATWTIPVFKGITTTCAADGLHMIVAQGANPPLGITSFSLPGQSFSANYRAGITFAFVTTNATYCGVMDILVHQFDDESLLLCSDGSWLASRAANSQSTQLGTGRLALSNQYQITMQIDQGILLVQANGVTLVNVPETTLALTDTLKIGTFSDGKKMVEMVLSNFTYTPIP